MVPSSEGVPGYGSSQGHSGVENVQSSVPGRCWLLNSCTYNTEVMSMLIVSIRVVIYVEGAVLMSDVNAKLTCFDFLREGKEEERGREGEKKGGRQGKEEEGRKEKRTE